MPYIPGGLTISDIVKFIPKSWKKQPSHVPRTPKIHNDSMLIESLFKSLGHLASHGHLHEAFKTFTLLRLHSFAVSGDLVLHSAASILSACVDVRAFLPGLQIHAHCISSGVEYHSALVPKLVTFYSAFNLHSEAQSINENSGILHPLPWNVLIASYAKNEFFEETVAAYKRMVSKGIRPDAFTYPSVLKACGETLDFACGRVVHGSIEVSTYKSSLYVCNALISMYKRFGNVSIARRLFDRMSERDAVSWNAVISCYASEGVWSEAFELFDKMWFSGVEVSVITWNIVSGGCLHTGNYAGALGLVSRMRNFPTSLDPVAVIIGLKACSLLGAIRLGKEIHGFAIRCFYDGIDNVRNTLITMYSKCDDLRHAFTVFQQIEENSLSTWNSIISGYAQVNRSEEASYLLREMLLAGFQPNSITLASILPLCARVANLQHGKEFHCYILRRSFEDYTMLWNSLVDVYAKSGKIVAAKQVSDLMSERDEVTYTCLIDGYGNQGEGKVALALFSEMLRSGIKPDHVTMVAVLSACSHSKLVHEGERLFMKMECEYGIHPCLQHFSCMVDLYGRAGLLVRARDIIHRMPYEPSGAIWATLLNACHIHGNTEIGEWAAEKLLEMKPENPGYYVLIANMYAAAGSWSKLAEVRTFMRDLGMKKAPGCAWIDTDSGFTLFSAGDTSSPQACDTFPLLDGLNQLMKDAAGYAINKEQSSDEEILQEIG
ncbi:Pentatricopeptide repeat-containing protein [Cardamine amara subsp. amara]|uniref:Pentatricopeptide repeat-containing protein n=1 Tax=Cardamine amara subsp. amara TaxID=228776 RepID=A0ABD1BHD8_CARAN